MHHILLTVVLAATMTAPVTGSGPVAGDRTFAVAAASEPLPPMTTGAPPGTSAADELEPEVTIVPRDEQIFEEFRIHGRLYMVKVYPAKGPPYYLIDHEGQGRFRRSDLEPSIAIPNWVIKRF